MPHDVHPEPGSAHLRTLREACGLTAQSAADLCGVSLRSWQYWESPDSTAAIKPDVRAKLDELLALKRQAAALMARGGGPLVRYVDESRLRAQVPEFDGPLGTWNSAVGAAAEELGDEALVVWG